MSTRRLDVVLAGSDEIVNVPTVRSASSSVASLDRYTRPVNGVSTPFAPLLRIEIGTGAVSFGPRVPMGNSTAETYKSTAQSLRGSSGSSGENFMQTRSEQGWGGERFSFQKRKSEPESTRISRMNTNSIKLN